MSEGLKAAFTRYLREADEQSGRRLDAGTIDRLVADLIETQAELNGGTIATLDEWLRRIGGWANVPSYAATLAAGERRQLQAKAVTLSHGVPGVQLPSGSTQACDSPEQAEAMAGAVNRLAAARTQPAGDPEPRYILTRLKADPMVAKRYRRSGWMAFDRTHRSHGQLWATRSEAQADVARLNGAPAAAEKAARYDVVCGNVCTVYTGNDAQDALSTFYVYVEQSKSGVGRAGGEDVTMLKDGEITFEYQGSLSAAAGDDQE